MYFAHPVFMKQLGILNRCSVFISHSAMANRQESWCFVHFL